MTPTYTFEINKKSYLLKRFFHRDLPVTYHIHFLSGDKNRILRMGMVDGKWAFLNSMHIRFNFQDLQFHLATEIGDNEKRIVAGQEEALACFGLN